MAKITLWEKIINRHQENSAAADAARKELVSLEELQTAQINAAESAAAAGDLEGYQDNRSKADKTAAAIHVKKAQLDSLQAPAELEEVKAAWLELVEPFNKGLEKKKAAYLKTRAELYRQLEEILAIQETAFANRREAFSLAGLSIPKNNAITDGNIIYKDFPMETLQQRDFNEDCLFFMRSGETSQEIMERYYKVATRHGS